MKKLLILLVVLSLMGGFAFAQEENGEPEKRERKIELFNFEIGVGFPIHWTNGLHNDRFYTFNPQESRMEDKTVTSNTSVGIGLVFNFTRTLGLALDADMFYGAKLAGFSAPTSDYNSLFGANVIMGPVFYLFNNNMFRIPLTIGGHMYYFSEDLWVTDLQSGTWIKRTDLQVGAALGLGVQFHFDKSIYMFTRTNVMINFFRVHTMDWYNPGIPDGSGGYLPGEEPRYESKTCRDIMDISWGVRPVFGIGIKY
ncbi:MAG: hypothetical protein FWD14_06450 [Treponema sp.]|nr:hypothetical protein [Treponema sp.]